MKIIKQFHEYLNHFNNVSKTSILIIGTVVLSIFNLNATNENKAIEITDITKEHMTQVFEWKVKTTKRTYSGTSLSLENAKQMVVLSSSGEIIHDTEISSYFVLKSEINSNSKRNYFWTVETATGFAKGYTSSENFAHQMIRLVATGDAIVSKIIISQPQH